MARGIRPFIVWGTSAPQERLIFGWPLDSALTYPIPRNGSEWVTLPSGVVDAWLVGHDSVLTAKVRSIPRVDEITPRPASGWESPGGWDAFLRWAREGGAFTLFADGRNHVSASNMDTDTDASGVVNDFTSGAGGTAGVTPTYSLNGGERAQQIAVAGTGDATSWVQVRQDVAGRFVAGMTVTLSADAISGLTSATAHVRIQALDAALAVLGELASGNATGAYSRLSTGAFTVPAGTRYLRVIFRVQSLDALAKSGNARCRDMMLSVGTETVYVAQPGGVSCYLQAPLDTPAGSLERNLNYRALDLELRAADGSNFTGF